MENLRDGEISLADVHKLVSGKRKNKYKILEQRRFVHIILIGARKNISINFKIRMTCKFQLLLFRRSSDIV